MTAGIYRIRVLRGGEQPPKFYIGQAAILRKRRTAHLRALRRGRHRNQPLQRAFAKYGEASFTFEVLLVCERLKAILDFYEQAVLDSYDDASVYNLSRACVGSRLGIKSSAETRAKIGNGNRGKPRSPEHRTAVALANSRRTVSAETRAKMSAARMGNKNSAGHVPTAEHRAKIGAAFKGKKKPAEEIDRRQRARARNRAAQGLSVY